MRLNILIGGKAGQGPNILADIVSKAFISRGFYVFNSREYGSVIRGGHNYNLISISDSPISSNHLGTDILVCLDENTEKLHKSSLNKKALVLNESSSNMYYAGSLFKIFGFNFWDLEADLRKLRKSFEQNIKDSREGYNFEKHKIELPVLTKNAADKNAVIKENKFLHYMNGSQALAKGCLMSGLEYYYSYPMTPATPLAMELSQLQTETKGAVKTIELENEIAVITSALGSSLAGARAMCGTSGGGFDLMTESLSLSGQAEIPIIVYLASRPGPSTGLATYTSQADLNLALYSGHGEFSRLVIAPGDAKESIEIAGISFSLSEKYKIPAIILGDKHLGESKYTFIDDSNTLILSKKTEEIKKFNSYEHDKEGIATEDSEIINKNFKSRREKSEKIKEEIEKSKEIVSHKIHGEKNSKNLVLSWGSTKGAILDAITYSNLNAKFLQIIIIEPFSDKIIQEIKKYSPEKIILLENNATSPLSKLIAEKCLIEIPEKNKILKYDGRPFTSTEIEKELRKRGVK